MLPRQSWRGCPQDILSKTITMTATCSPRGGINHLAIWSSSNTLILTRSGNVDCQSRGNAGRTQGLVSKGQVWCADLCPFDLYVLFSTSQRVCQCSILGVLTLIDVCETEQWLRPHAKQLDWRFAGQRCGEGPAAAVRPNHQTCVCCHMLCRRSRCCCRSPASGAQSCCSTAAAPMARRRTNASGP